MDVPAMTPAPIGSDRDVPVANAYELFWDCLENESPIGDEGPPSDPEADAYHRFWQQAEL